MRFRATLLVVAFTSLAFAQSKKPLDHTVYDLWQSVRSQAFSENGAWLGYGVFVSSGVRIGKGAVVGAHSVVTKSVPAGAIVAGVPARVVKMREDLRPSR